MESNITTTDTKSDALRSVRLSDRSRQALAIEDIVRRFAPDNEHRNLSGREIQYHYERAHAKRIEMSTVAGRVNDLVAASRLVRATKPRACSVTGNLVMPVYLAQSQLKIV